MMLLVVNALNLSTTGALTSNFSAALLQLDRPTKSAAAPKG
jgi:hypothetical protein